MTQVAFDLPENAFSALRLGPDEFVDEMRIAAAVQWYAEHRISQSKGAEIAGLSRTDFISELHRRHVPAIQLSAADLEGEFGDQ